MLCGVRNTILTPSCWCWPRYEGASGAFATQTLAYTVAPDSGGGAGGGEELRATIGAARANGGFELPATQVLHSLELRGRPVPSSATMGGAAMRCSATSAAQASVARPAGTVVCGGPARHGLGEAVEVLLRFGSA